jgi:hypothetical protein
VLSFDFYTGFIFYFTLCSSHKTNKQITNNYSQHNKYTLVAVEYREMNNRTQCAKKVHVILLLLAISSKVHSFPVTSDNKLFRQRTSSIHHHHHGHNLRLPSLHDLSIRPCRPLDDCLIMVCRYFILHPTIIY